MESMEHEPVMKVWALAYNERLELSCPESKDRALVS